MDKKQNPYDLGLLAAGVGLIVGSFSPWISQLPNEPIWGREEKS